MAIPVAFLICTFGITYTISFLVIVAAYCAVAIPAVPTRIFKIALVIAHMVADHDFIAIGIGYDFLACRFVVVALFSEAANVTIAVCE